MTSVQNDRPSRSSLDIAHWCTSRRVAIHWVTIQSIGQTSNDSYRHRVALQRLEPTPAQIKAVASSLRLRIVRLCNDREWTNKELADRLERDPATILHHLRLLVDAELIAPVGVRQGASGAYEKPYRSTGLSWQLSFETAAEDEDAEGELAMLTAFRHELAEAGHDSIVELSRFHLHVNDDERATFIARFKSLIDEYVVEDPARRDRGAPAYSGVFVLHRLADPSDNETAKLLASQDRDVDGARDDDAASESSGRN
ncbi:MAG: winged helix-turn-helix domain-containing protein [Actinomycetota bacterium]|nr:winged helix-turn-helix domain-containing protein [Actinomycetota bacterium]